MRELIFRLMRLRLSIGGFASVYKPVIDNYDVNIFLLSVIVPERERLVENLLEAIVFLGSSSGLVRANVSVKIRT